MSRLIKPLLLAATLLSAPSAFADTQAPTSKALANTTAFIGHYDAAFDTVVQAWPGFTLGQIPKVIIARNQAGDIRSLVAIDHPNPSALGTATPVASAKGDVYIITDIISDLGLEWVENFEFSIPLGGADSFVIAANCEGPEYSISCHADPDFTSYLVHEVFHRFQDDVFQEQNFVDQETYDYRPENLRVAMLENALIVKMSQTPDTDRLSPMARDLVALRRYRARMGDFVALDEQQERFEGTARFIEDQTATPDRVTPAEELTFPLAFGDVKAEFGFGRFYLTGALMVDTLQRLGLDGAHDQMKAGASPMQIMATAFPVADDEIDPIVDRLTASLDPNGEMAENAKQYAIWAKTEPGVFDE